MEGLSLAMLEAMACGTATVATDVGSDGEALEGAGVVIDPSRLDTELRLAVRLLVATPELCALLGSLARKRVVERFSLSANLDGLLHLSDAPGLGIELKAATVERLTLPPGSAIPDGHYSDLSFGARYYTEAVPYGAQETSPGGQ